MERIDLPVETARVIGEYDSHGTRWSSLPSTDGPAHIGVMRYESGAVLGRHPAAVDQLFIVVSGTGWVQSKKNPRETIAEGTAVLWRAGEVHESGSDEGMTALIIQAERFQQTE